ncbi:VOC family protein [Silvimonas sp. JCM 19000]
MFDHVVFGVSDYAASKAFYLAALAPLGIRLVAENALGVEMCSDDECSLCLFPTHEKPAHLHLAFRADTRAQVDAFYHAALAAGGIDHGAPGLRVNYGPNYYAAFVIAPDGHNVEVVCHQAER